MNHTDFSMSKIRWTSWVGIFLLFIGIFVSLTAQPYNPTIIAQSYLVSYLFWLGVSLGSFGICMLYQVVGGRMFAPLLPLLQGAIRLLPLLTCLFIPILFALPYLYPWVHRGAEVTNQILHHRRPYLNVPFFVVRAFAYFTIWNLWSWQLHKLLQQREQFPKAVRQTDQRLRRLAIAGLILLIVTVTFSWIDWAASLEYSLVSSGYGLLAVAQLALNGLAFCVLFLTLLTANRSLSLFREAQKDLGTLTLAFILLWAYLTFMHFLIMWNGNLPREVEFYAPRIHDEFGWLAVCAMITHGILPFLLLLSRSIKGRPFFLGVLTLLILLSGMLESFWWISPGFHRTQRLAYPSDLGMFLALGGCFLFTYARSLRRLGVPQLERYSTTPVNDRGKRPYSTLTENPAAEQWMRTYAREDPNCGTPNDFGEEVLHDPA